MSSKEYHRRYYQEHKERIKENYLAHREETLRKMKEHYQALKREVLSYYCNKSSPECIICKEKRLACLSIDHINGGGKQHRKDIKVEGQRFYLWLKKQGFPEGYQTLCMNCQWVKNLEGKC